MVETKRAPLEAGGAKGALLVLDSEDSLGALVPLRGMADMDMRFSLDSARRVGSSGDRRGCLLCHFLLGDRDIRPCTGGKGLNSRSAWMTATFSMQSKTSL